MLSSVMAGEAAQPLEAPMPKREKQPARVRVVFMYPPADVVNAGQNEDSWRVHNWFTWPGNQFEPEVQQHKFTQKIEEMTARLGIAAEFAPRAIYQEARVQEFIDKAKADTPDAVLVVNFWNTLAKASFRIATESAPTAIVYQPVGGNHQLPPEELRAGEGFYYIHSIENWDEIERGLRAVRAKKMLAQSRLLRVACKPPERVQEPRLEVDVAPAPAEEFNAIFDAIRPDDAMVRQAMEIKKNAARVTDVVDEYFVDAMRAHRAVGQIMERYGADAITIESPASPPTGGCATRLLMEVDGADDICKVYHGPHPVMFCGNRGDARRLRAFAKMYRLKLEGNLA